MATDSTNTTSHTAPSNWFRGFIQGKTRIALAWAFVALLIFCARALPQWPGIALCFVGATLRYWASGYLRKDSRPAVGGPYAFVRNPLYLGTYLMALGTALAIENFWLLGVATVLFAVIYHFIILDEENKLHRIFGAPYARYIQLSARFFPRPLPLFWPLAWRAHQQALLEVNPEPTHHRFSRELAAKNKAFEAYVSFFGLIGFVAIVAMGWRHLGY